MIIRFLFINHKFSRNNRKFFADETSKRKRDKLAALYNYFIMIKYTQRRKGSRLHLNREFA